MEFGFPPAVYSLLSSVDYVKTGNRRPSFVRSYCSCNFWTFRWATPPAFAEFSGCICGFASANKEIGKISYGRTVSVDDFSDQRNQLHPRFLVTCHQARTLWKHWIYGTGVYLSPIPCFTTCGSHHIRPHQASHSWGFQETGAWVQQ